MTSAEKLRYFCQKVSGDITKRISQSKDDSEGSVLLHTYNEKCQAILARIKGKEDDFSKEDVYKTLKDISQLMLDVTYVQEIELVEDDFSHESAEEDIKSIIDSLSSLESLSEELCPGEEVVTSLGAEILECLRWRKGALLYMFCHTIHNQNTERGIPSHQHHYLTGGVDYLVAMLKTRSGAKWLEFGQESQTKDDNSDTLRLIEEGIFSDTHLLALMYCGEMCYWHAMSCHKIKISNASTALGNCTSNNGENPLIEPQTENTSKTDHSRPSGGSQTHSPAAETSAKSKDDGDRKVDLAEGYSDTSNNVYSCENQKNAVNSSSLLKSMQKETSASDSKMVDTGNACLQKYLSITKGPLSWAGWSTDAAEDIIVSFHDLKL